MTASIRALTDALASLPPEISAVIQDHIKPTSANRVRLARRDEAIRAAVKLFNETAPTAAAVRLEIALNRHRARCQVVNGKSTPPLPGNNELAQLIQRIIELNTGRALRWRQIRNILLDQRKH